MELPPDLLPQLPDEVRDIIAGAPEAEFATLSSAGMPVCNPLFHYYGPNGSIDVATGVAYPAKANRARRNPRVGLLFAPGVAAHDPVVKGTLAGQVGSVANQGATSSDAPVVVVAAVATVRDDDIQANTDRYVRDFLREHPLRVPWEVDRVRVWYYARIYVECQPYKILWWPEGVTSGKPPKEWMSSGLRVPSTTSAPVRGGRGKEWPTAEWQEVADRVMADIPAPTLTLADDEGFPLTLPTLGAQVTASGFELDLPASRPWHRSGPACLTFAVSGTFLGTASLDGERVRFDVERVVGNLPLAGNELLPRDSDRAKAELMERLTAELARLGQELPEVRLTPQPKDSYPFVERYGSSAAGR